MPIASVDFDLVRRTVFENAGIVIEPGKEYLVESRLIAARAAARQFSIWCAASSTGQEPYSLAMLLSVPWRGGDDDEPG